MATTAPSRGERSSADATTDGVQLRHLPLSRIVVPAGFNPRGEVVEDREFEHMVESIRQHGCLQPIRVRATEHGDYVLYLQ
jgi:ParB-like chromosome segregation protein Spo0J